MYTIAAALPGVKGSGPDPVVRYPETLRESMSRFLGEQSWDWWVTLTWAEDVGSYTAQNRTREWLRYLEHDMKRWPIKGKPRRKVGAFVAWEHHKYSRSTSDTLTPHAHLLVAGVADLERRDAWRFTWDRNGRARIEPYDPQLGAARYITKYIAKEVFNDGAWDLWRPEAIPRAVVAGGDGSL